MTNAERIQLAQTARKHYAITRNSANDGYEEEQIIEQGINPGVGQEIGQGIGHGRHRERVTNRTATDEEEGYNSRKNSDGEKEGGRCVMS